MVETILSYLWQAISAALIQILILFGPGLLLTLILYFETRFIQNRAVGSIGRNWYLGLFGWLGTVIHEMGHALFCIIFGHKITDIKLFHPDPQTGTLGYVKHSYKRTNLYQLAGNFFIGIGPILLGMAVISLLAYWLFGLNPFNLGNNFSPVDSQSISWNTFGEISLNLWNASSHLITGIFSVPHLSSWQIYVFLYLAFAIGTALTLSPPDTKAALSGFLVIVILIFILNLSTVWAGNFILRIVIGVSGYYVLFYGIGLLILLVNLVVALLILLPLSFKKGQRAKAS